MSWSKILPFRKRTQPAETPHDQPVVDAFPRFRKEWADPVHVVRGRIIGFAIPPSRQS